MRNLENNRLIAEFMNYNLEIVNNEVYFTHDDMLESLSDEELHFDTDWNWLMLVVDKIESLKATIRLISNFNPFHNQNYHQVTIEIAEGKLSESKKTFSSNGFIYKYHSNSGLNRIDCYYESIIEFINWHNGKN